MLDLLRRKAQSFAIQVIIGLIALVFILWGVGSDQGSRQNVVAIIDDTAISFDEFKQRYNQVLSSQREKFGGNIPEDLLTSFISKQQVLDQLIQEVLLQKGAKDSGLHVSNQEIQKLVADMEVFKANGSFDMSTYEEILNLQRLSPTDFETSIESDLLTQKAAGSLGRFAKISPEMLKDRFAMEYEETTLQYVMLSPENFTKDVKVDNDALNAYFHKHANKYKTDPQVNLTYLLFPFGADTSISDDEISIYYQQNIDNFSQPEKRKARHILVRVPENASADILGQKRAEAENILAKAKKGQNFAKLAKQYSEDKGSGAQGGDLGFFSRGQMVGPFDEAVFAMQPGTISDLVKTRYGFHIIQLEKIQSARTQTLAQVKNDIKKKLLEGKGKTMAFKKANEAYKQIILTGSLKKYAEQQNITLDTTGLFSRKSPPRIFAGDPAFLNSAFSLKEGELSSILEMKKGFGILFVGEFKKPAVPPFASVQTAVKKDFTAAQSTELAKAAAENMLANLKKGTDFGKEAGKMKLTLKKSPAITRADKSAVDLPGSISAGAFTLTADNPYPESVVTDKNIFYVYKLLAKKQAPDELYESKKDSLRQQLLEEQKMATLASWLKTIQDNTEVTIHQQYLQ